MLKRGLIVLVLLGSVLAASLPSGALAATTKTHPYNKGCDLLKQGRLDAAATAFEDALELNSRDTDAANNLAVVYIRQARYDSALETLEKVLKTNPKYRGADLNIGASYILQTQLDSALAPTERASTASGGSGAAKVRDAAYYNLGLLAAAEGDYDTATEWFRKTTDSESSRMALAVLRCARGDIEPGVAELEAFIDDSGDSEAVDTARRNLQIAYYQQGLRELAAQRLTQADTAFTASADAGENGYASLGLALVEAQRGRLAQARAALTRIENSDAPAEVKAAAKENGYRIDSMSNGKTVWLKWLCIPLALVVAGALLVAFVALAKAPSWGVKNKPLRVIVGFVLGLLSLSGLVTAFGDPARSVGFVAVWTVLGLGVAAWIAAGVRS